MAQRQWPNANGSGQRFVALGMLAPTFCGSSDAGARIYGQTPMGLAMLAQRFVGLALRFFRGCPNDL